MDKSDRHTYMPETQKLPNQSSVFFYYYSYSLAEKSGVQDGSLDPWMTSWSRVPWWSALDTDRSENILLH